LQKALSQYVTSRIVEKLTTVNPYGDWEIPLSVHRESSGADDDSCTVDTYYLFGYEVWSHMSCTMTAMSARLRIGGEGMRKTEDFVPID
jgi:hypothetical protein